MKETPRHTIRRHLDEAKLELGDTISLKDGAVGLVLARYIPSCRPDEVCYVVERISNDGEKERLDEV